MSSYDPDPNAAKRFTPGDKVKVIAPGHGPETAVGMMGTVDPYDTWDSPEGAKNMSDAGYVWVKTPATQVAHYFSPAQLQRQPNIECPECGEYFWLEFGRSDYLCPNCR